MFSRILVPLDGSPLAERALLVAVNLARRFQSELELVQVLPLLFAGDGPLPPMDTGTLEAYLEGLARPLRQELSVGTVVQIGASVSGAILERPADLIVLTSHGRSGLSRFVFGSTAGQIVRHASCPTLVLPSSGELPASFEKVLVPLDGSYTAEQALPYARKLGSQVTALQSFVIPEQQADAEEYLAGMDVARIVRAGVPEDVILEEAPRHDLIVMTSHGRRGISRWVIGSVCERVVQASPRPVLILTKKALKD